jgi:hypothetical protein
VFTLTDAFSELLESEQSSNLGEETEARWRLVETAWELGVSSSLLTVKHDPETEALFMIDPLRGRRPITGARTALSGYQKGHCFYCFDGFPLLGSPPPDIDHFFPHSLKSVGFKGVDSVWNLVLACRRCNRGSNGKFNPCSQSQAFEAAQHSQRIPHRESPSIARDLDHSNGR